MRTGLGDDFRQSPQVVSGEHRSACGAASRQNAIGLAAFGEALARDVEGDALIGFAGTGPLLRDRFVEPM